MQTVNTETEKEGYAMQGKDNRKRFIVETHLGPQPTVASSPDKAINNVRYRIFGTSRNNDIVKYWTVKEAS